LKNSYKRSLDTYDKRAKALCNVYNGLSTPDVLPGFGDRLPDPAHGMRALDLGCGSGRDAYWLAEKGFTVVAIDGAAEMIREAQAHRGHPLVTYLKDLMPELNAVKARGERFDVVLLSASWMHLDKPDRARLFENLLALTNKNALIYISLRTGPSPEDRPMFRVSSKELQQLATRNDIGFERLGRVEDKQGRNGVSWDYVALRR